jgi:hypothetical protein
MYYGHDQLFEMLGMPCSFPLNHWHKGVLHWLGTDHGKSAYRNPFVTSEVHGGGWVDWTT